eukprot:29100-Amphidinium_carterae.1
MSCKAERRYMDGADSMCHMVEPLFNNVDPAVLGSPRHGTSKNLCVDPSQHFATACRAAACPFLIGSSVCIRLELEESLFSQTRTARSLALLTASKCKC